MDGFHSSHFMLTPTEDGWIVQARVTKDFQGDWLLNHHELEELRALLDEAIAA